MSFSSGSFWRSFVQRKTKETLSLFCRTANGQTVYRVSHRFLAVFKSKENSIYSGKFGNSLFTLIIVTRNTTVEVIEHVRKYHITIKRYPSLELCQLVS